MKNDVLISKAELLNSLEELEEEWEDAGLRPSYYEAKRVIKNAKEVIEEPVKTCIWELTGDEEWKVGCVAATAEVHNIKWFAFCPCCGGKLKLKRGE